MIDTGTANRTPSNAIRAALMACVAVTLTASAQAQCAWEQFPAPHISQDIHDLKGVHGVATDDVWAVGTYVQPGPPYQRLNYVAHFDGRQWTLVDVPSPGTTWNELHDVVAVSTNEAYAAGNRNGAGAQARSQFLTWDGVRWEHVDVPPQPGGDLINDLALVDGRIWLAGIRGGDSVAEPSNIGLAGWYDGADFVFEHVPWITLPEGRSHNNLRAIDGVAPDAMWAVGWAQGATGPIVGWAYVVRRDADGWHAEDHIFGDPTKDSAFNDVLVLGRDDVWTVGYTGKAPMIAHFDGSEWHEPDLSHLGLDWAELRAVRATDSGELYAAGNRFTLDASGRYGIASPLVLRYDGATWTIMPTATADQPYYQFFGLGVVPGGDAWAVGNLVEPTTGLAPPLTERLACPSCRPDLDADGELTIFDFLTFQNLFDAADPRADFDGDGQFTIFDFLAFQNEFDAGCE